jgi:hypothetical protein
VGSVLALLLLSSAYSAAAHPGNRVVRQPAPSSAATEPAPVVEAAPPPESPLTSPAVFPGEPPGLFAAPSTPVFPWILGAVMLALAGMTQRSRRVAAWAAALLLAVFVAESGVHSVHHLTDPGGAARCQVLALAQHLDGSAADGPTVATPPSDTGPLLATPAASFRPDEPLRPDRSRAPPVSIV